MFGSRVCFQLLLGWVLLLGQPVCGVETEFEEQKSPLAEDREEPSASEEESDITSKELEELVREDEALMEKDPQLLKTLTERFSAMAMDFYNKRNDGFLYKLVDEERSLTFKKAIGTMAYLRLFLGKTNCTNDQVHPGHDIMDFMERMHLARHHPLPELRRCVLPPVLEREMLDCTFDLFLDERSHWETVVGHRCKPFEFNNLAETNSSVE